MKTWLVACAKGGVGKTTIATHLAAYSALRGLRTVLVDADPQASATRWCERRAGLASAVLPLDGTRRSWRKQLPDDAERVVVDAPAGAMHDALEPFLDAADAVLVPIQPSVLDMEASARFLESLARHARVRKGKLRVGLVGNRLKPRLVEHEPVVVPGGGGEIRGIGLEDVSRAVADRASHRADC